MVNLRKIFLAVIVVSVIPFSSYCWMRDADIAHSRDCISLGWLDGINIAGEKIIDKETSVGFIYLPWAAGLYLNQGDVTYNKQFYKSNEGGSSSSWYIGAIYFGPYGYMKSLFEEIRGRGGWSDFMPILGIAFSWKLGDSSKIRVSFPNYPFFEYAFMINDKYEMGIQFGWQLINLKYVF